MKLNCECFLYAAKLTGLTVGKEHLTMSTIRRYATFEPNLREKIRMVKETNNIHLHSISGNTQNLNMRSCCC